MKDMKVGKRIAMGFGSIVVLVLILTAVTLVTSLTRQNDLKQVDFLSKVQMEANTLLDNMNEAKSNSQMAFSAFDAEPYYQVVLGDIDSALVNLTNIDNYWNEMGNDNANLNAQIRSDIGSLKDHLQKVRTNDGYIAKHMEIMTADSDNLQAASAELFSQIAGAIEVRAGDDGALTAERIRTILIPAQQICTDAGNMLNNSSTLFVGLDTSVTPGLREELAAISAKATQLRSVVTTDESRATIDGMISAIAEYSAELEAFDKTIVDSDRSIAEFNAMLDSVVTRVSGGVDADNISMSQNMKRTMNRSTSALVITLLIAVIAVGMSGAIATVLGRNITRPLEKMQAVVRQAGETGNLNFSEEVREDILKEAQAQDEIGQSLKEFARFVDRTRYIGDCLERVARKDLSLEIDLLGEEDTMGNALKTMLENLNGMFIEINGVAAQVSTASSEISLGAQSLAQGSTEQASTIQEISASISEITEQNKSSSQRAADAAQHSSGIQTTALDGNQKMAHMITSVQEINTATLAIENVIKVIDDIAFQTNMLALNASVEAARAGEHGKGFAVVADEVRKLAGESANAAKGTSDLISANIQKADEGVSVANETADSLRKIVAGIEETNHSLEQIVQDAATSEYAISQVNIAISQVAQVVQQNSATSEQSAAASEELSSQAQALQALIAQFKLKDSYFA